MIFEKSPFKVSPGKFFKKAPVEDIMQFLEQRKLERKTIAPDKMKFVFSDDNHLMLEMKNGSLSRFPEGNRLITEYAAQKEGNRTLYDFYNFITALANNFENDPLKSLQLQEYAGEVMSVLD